jgi:hypothetical protein
MTNFFTPNSTPPIPISPALTPIVTPTPTQSATAAIPVTPTPTPNVTPTPTQSVTAAIPISSTLTPNVTPTTTPNVTPTPTQSITAAIPIVTSIDDPWPEWREHLNKIIPKSLKLHATPAMGDCFCINIASVLSKSEVQVRQELGKEFCQIAFGNDDESSSNLYLNPSDSHPAMVLLSRHFLDNRLLFNTQNVKDYLSNFKKPYSFIDYHVILPVVNSLYQIGVEIFVVDQNYTSLHSIIEEGKTSDWGADFNLLTLDQTIYPKQVKMVYHHQHYDLLTVDECFFNPQLTPVVGGFFFFFFFQNI